MRMCCFREVPFDPKVFAKADEEHTLALLRNAVVCSVENLRNNTVMKTLPITAGMIPLQLS